MTLFRYPREMNIVLQRGDVIERRGPLGTMHRGIFVGPDAFGRPCVIHNPKDGNVRYDFYETFADGKEVRFLKRVARNIQEQNLVVTRAHSRLGEPYDLLNFNCDHLVTYALAGAASSPQLSAFVGALALAGLIGMVVAIGE